MDITGAKALRERLGHKGTDEAPPASAEVFEDAPPVYHWTGVSWPGTESSPLDADGDGATQSASLFQRLGLSFR